MPVYLISVSIRDTDVCTGTFAIIGQSYKYSVATELTHWGRDKMAAIFQTTFQMDFLEWKFMNFE